MKPFIDTHTHTIASGHWTTDTVTDLARAAAERGIKILGVTDHSPSIPGAATENYFLNLKYAEKNRFGVRILYGTEAEKIDIIGHPDDEKYPLLAEELVRACKEFGTAIEMNEASLTPGGYRGNAKARDSELLKLCAKADVFVAMGSDSHGAAHVGVFTYAEELIRETGFPRELVVNYSADRFLDLLNSHRGARGQKSPLII